VGVSEDTYNKFAVGDLIRNVKDYEDTKVIPIDGEFVVIELNDTPYTRVYFADKEGKRRYRNATLYALVKSANQIEQEKSAIPPESRVKNWGAWA
jgi:hypothetical protein